MARAPRRGLPPEITGLPFFFDCFTNSDEAAEYVMQHDQGPGTFLLRPSNRLPSALTLTISIHDNNVRHVNVQHMDDLNSPTGRRYFIIIERSFSTFHDLYAHYSSHHITNLEQINDVRLLNPLNRTDFANQPPDSPLMSYAEQEVPFIPSDLEIPPLPKSVPKDRKSSGLPEVPRDKTADRGPLNSEGEDQRTSSSSNGSGPPGLDGAVGGEGLSLPHAQSGPTVSSPVLNHTIRGSVSSGGLPVDRNAVVVDFKKPSDLTPLPDADGDVNFYLGPQQWQSVDSTPHRSVPLPLTAMTAKEEKKKKKQEKKEEKQRQKEEKRREKEEKQRQDEERRKKKNQKVLSDLGWCRPPQPLPTPAVAQDDETPYYSTPRPYRNHLEELKTMLRESEICDCGLRMIDAELSDGWTVHRSREQATFMRVFYQHENGSTTWVFPSSIANLITMRQVQFILGLCQAANVEEPPILRQRWLAEQPREGYYPRTQQVTGLHHTRSNTSVSSERSRTSSGSSLRSTGEAGNPSPSYASQSPNSQFRNASLDKRPPMPPP